MQFALSTTKEALISPLNFVVGAADYRGTVPMLGTALLKTTGGRLSLLCSDGAVLARTLAECKVDHEGELAVDARRFGDLIKAMPDKQAISLAMDGEQLLVKAGRSRFRLPVHSAEDYPKMVTSDEGKVTIQISSKRLGEMFEEVSAAMASADVRHFLNVTCLTLMDGALWTVATDGHRMIVSCQPIEGSEKIPATEVLVPRKSALLARKLLATSTEDATLVFGKGEFRIQFKDGTVLLSKCVDGKYPDWKRVIPETPCVAASLRQITCGCQPCRCCNQRTGGRQPGLFQRGNQCVGGLHHGRGGGDAQGRQRHSSGVRRQHETADRSASGRGLPSLDCHAFAGLTFLRNNTLWGVY